MDIIDASEPGRQSTSGVQLARAAAAAAVGSILSIDVWKKERRLIN